MELDKAFGRIRQRCEDKIKLEVENPDNID
jgi:hypothetical protein